MTRDEMIAAAERIRLDFSARDLLDLSQSPYYCDGVLDGEKRARDIQAIADHVAVPSVGSTERAAQDWADDHTHLQALCRAAGVPEDQVAGDEYGVPGIRDLADALAAAVKAAVEEMRERAAKVVETNVEQNCMVLPGREIKRMLAPLTPKAAAAAIRALPDVL